LGGAGEANEYILGILHAGSAAQILETHWNRFDETSAGGRGSEFTHDKRLSGARVAAGAQGT
jgi:hypothetical protein